MVELASHILSMSDAEKAAWLTKAVHDCLNGCTDADADPFIKVQYDNTMNEITAKQEYDARRYQQHKALCSGKPNTISTNDKTAEVTTPSAGGSCANPLATTLCTEVSTDNASKEGGDTREDSMNVHDSDAPKGVSTAGGTLESRTPSLLPFTVTTTRNQLAGEITPESQDKTSLPVSLAGNAPASTSGVKKPYGTCGHVMLTDEEGHHLREVYGENLRIAIDILDAYIENNGKAAKRYKNHAAVMRKGNWVWRNVQEMKRLENSANRSGKSFKQQDRDHQSELLHTSLFAPSIGNKRIANG